MSTSESRKKANAKWDAANMMTLGCRVRKEQAAAFKAVCAAAGTTANTALKDYVMERIGAKSPDAVGVSGGEGILTSETLKLATEAAQKPKKTLETVTEFIERAVESRDENDNRQIRMGIDPVDVWRKRNTPTP